MNPEARLTDEQRQAVEEFRRRHRTAMLALVFTDVEGSTALRSEIGELPASALWNELIERYHYLGYKPLPGEQLRYLVRAHGDRWSEPPLLAALGFGAAAWMVAPRDRYIGWTAAQRKRNLHLIVNNARFLILPWVQVRNLASTILAHAARRIANDWNERYGFQPVLLETFVDLQRFRGTCYRAANWIHVGQTQGRGKLNKTHIRLEPIKNIYLHPLTQHFRHSLRNHP